MSAPFFGSRWIEKPEHVSELDPTALPQGFRAAAVAAGLDPDGPDVGVLYSERPQTVVRRALYHQRSRGRARGRLA